MDALLIVLRVVHVGAAMAWFGGAIVGGFFLLPDRAGARSGGPAVHGAPDEAPPDGRLLPDRCGADDPRRGRAVLARLERAGLGLDLVAVGLAFTIGGVAAIVAFVGGMVLIGPSTAEQTAVQKELAASGGAPTRRTTRRLARADRRMRLANRIDLPLILLAGLTMAVGRYL